MAPMVFLASTLGLAVLWLWWFTNPTLPVTLASRQLFFDGKPSYDTLVSQQNGAYANRPVKVWTVYAVFSPDARAQIEQGQRVIVQPSVATVAGAGVLRGKVAENPSRMNPKVRITIMTELDRTLSPAEIGELRVQIAMQAPVDRVLSGSGLSSSGNSGVSGAGGRPYADRP